MTKKTEQAARTRSSLVLAAADNFDRHGYDGTSLASVCGALGISMGALTFHFRSKAALAAAVADEGAAELQRARAARPRTGRPLEDLSSLVQAVAVVLRESVRARSAARLIAEGQVHSTWPADWRDEVEELIELAWHAGELAEDIRPRTAARLVRHLVEGSAADARGTRGRAAPGAADFAEVWQAALTGLAAGSRPTTVGLP
ncbi:TetR/AcrR family transcriptional regulator [Streptomyces sp. NPDC048278]|uniref:TetR/AcrR family transcriptional regulator n=1 Tax=unclassified Streptomyces TaxID=2593676 RepID=UPI00342F61ED